MKTLIPMTDFVLEQNEIRRQADLPIEYETANIVFGQRVLWYAKFLKQPLKLEMFVPCDEDGNFLEEPQMIETQFGFDEVDCDYDLDEVESYKKAKEKVLFEGYSIGQTNKQVAILINSFHRIKWMHLTDRKQMFNGTDYSKEDLHNYDLKTIEDLIIFSDLKLTPTALNQIGL